MREEPSVDKIDKEFKRHIRPLYEVWREKACLTEIEKRILFLKEFDDRKLNEWEQLDELEKDFNYYVSFKTFQNHWRKLKKKIYKILP